MQDCKNICLFTATGAENLGDELITLCEIRHFREIFPGVHITLFSHNPARTRRFLISQKCPLSELLVRQYFPDNIRSTPLSNIVFFWQTLRAFSRADRIYIGGGGLLYGKSEEGHSPLRLWWFRAHLARIFRIPLYYYALGISAPLAELRPFARGLFSGAHICVRDDQSQAILSELGYASDVIPDPVFSFSLPRKSTDLSDVKTVGLALRSGFLPDNIVCDFIRGLQKKGYNVLLLPHSLHPTDERSHDGYYLQQFLLPGVQITQSIEQTLESYSRCHIVVGMRLHSIIIASSLGIPLVAVSYAKKTLTLLESLGAQFFTPDVSAEDLLSAIEQNISL